MVSEEVGEVVSEEAEKKHPWEKMPGENSLWYGRFSRYLEAGTGRTFQEVYNAEQETAGKGKKTTIAKSWSNASKKFRWVERSATYDDWRRAEKEREAVEFRRREQEQLLEARDELRKGELALAQRLKIKAEELLELSVEVIKKEAKDMDGNVMQIIVPEHKAFRTAAVVAKQYSEMARAALDMPVRKSQIDIRNLSDRDLLSLYEQLAVGEGEDGDK